MRPGTAVHPVEARLERDDVLAIRWSDDRDLSYPLDHLRAHCPCAHCTSQAGDDRAGRLGDFATVGLRSVEEVGNYALRIAFDDGHQLGIYTYEHLLRIGFPADRTPEAFEV